MGTANKRKKIVANIVTLKEKKFVTEPDLLLDVIDNGPNGILMYIIDLNGNRIYSNMVECHVD